MDKEKSIRVYKNVTSIYIPEEQSIIADKIGDCEED